MEALLIFGEPFECNSEEAGVDEALRVTTVSLWSTHFQPLKSIKIAGMERGNSFRVFEATPLGFHWLWSSNER